MSVPVVAAPKPPFLINRNFALLWIGQVISNVGDFVFTTTLVLWIATGLARDAAWAPLAVSGVSLAVTLPTFLVGPLAGVFVDRWDKRRTMLLMDVLRAALILALVPLALLPGDGLPVAGQLAAIYGVVIAATMCSQFFNPARMALIGDIVPPAQQPRASSLVFATLSLGLVLGPPLAAPLFFGGGAAWALGVDALTFGVSFAALALMRVPPAARSVAAGERGHLRREFGAGLSFALRQPVLRTILIAMSATLFGSSAINALGVFFLTENLHAPPELYGAMGTATGVGVLVGSAVVAWVVPRLGAARLLWGSILVVGAMILVYARLTVLEPALVLLFLMGLPGAGVNVAIGPMLLHVTPRELIGRVSAILNPAMSLAGLVSISIAGYLASTVLRDFHTVVGGIPLGRIDLIYTVAGLLIVGAGVYAAANLRCLTLAPREAAPPTPAPSEPSAAPSA